MSEYRSCQQSQSKLGDKVGHTFNLTKSPQGKLNPRIID